MSFGAALKTSDLISQTSLFLSIMKIIDGKFVYLTNTKIKNEICEKVFLYK